MFAFSKVADLCSCERDHTAHKASDIYYLTFYRKFANHALKCFLPSLSQGQDALCMWKPAVAGGSLLGPLPDEGPTSVLAVCTEMSHLRLEQGLFLKCPEPPSLCSMLHLQLSQDQMESQGALSESSLNSSFSWVCCFVEIWAKLRRKGKPGLLGLNSNSVAYQIGSHGKCIFIFMVLGFFFYKMGLIRPTLKNFDEN